jgi:hypothetical protein
MGRRIGRAFRSVGRAVGGVLKVAAPIASMIPGIGTAIGAGARIAGGLLSGDKFKDIAKSTLTGLIPGGGALGGIAKNLLGGAGGGIAGAVGGLLGGKGGGIMSAIGGVLGGGGGKGIGGMLGGLFGGDKSPIGGLVSSVLGGITGGGKGGSPLDMLGGLLGGGGGAGGLLSSITGALGKGPGGLLDVAKNVLGGALPGIMGPNSPLGGIMNSLGGGGVADLVKNIAGGGPAGQLVETMLQGSGAVGQAFGQQDMRGPNLDNLAQAAASLPGPAGQLFSAGLQAFSSMTTIMQQSQSMSATVTNAARLPVWG